AKPILDACDADLRSWEWERLHWLADRSDKTLVAHSALSEVASDKIEYSADGKRFFTFGDHHLVRIWDVDSFEEVAEISDPDAGEVTTARFSPDGRFIATGTRTGQFHVFESTTGKCVQTVQLEGSWARAIAIDPDNQMLATGTWFGPTTLWKIR